MQNFINQSGLSVRVSVDSAATHADEIGSPPYYETQRVLKEQKVPLVAHRAVQVTPADYERYDLILCVDDENMRCAKFQRLSKTNRLKFKERRFKFNRLRTPTNRRSLLHARF